MTDEMKVCNGYYGDEESCPVHGEEIRRGRGKIPSPTPPTESQEDRMQPFHELYERSKDDKAFIAGSEVREVIGRYRILLSGIEAETAPKICHYHNGPFQDECPLGGKCELLSDWGKVIAAPTERVGTSPEWTFGHGMGTNIATDISNLNVWNIWEPKESRMICVATRLTMSNAELICKLHKAAIAPSPAPARQEYQRGFNECREICMRIVDEHDGYLNRIEALEVK